MSSKVILQSIIVIFVLALIGIFFYFGNDLLPQNSNSPVEPTGQQKLNVDVTPSPISVDRIKTIEDEIATLKKTQDDMGTTIENLSKKETSITPDAITGTQDTISVVQAKGSLFTTTSNSYTPIGLFQNIACSTQCTLWINFYTVSKNIDSSNNVNSYGVFLDGQNQNLYTEANFPQANGALPLSLNASVSVSSGTHTVEIKAKTTGGTLQSDISSLQIMTIKQ